MTTPHTDWEKRFDKTFNIVKGSTLVLCFSLAPNSEKKGKIPLREWQEVLEKFGFRCAYCGSGGWLTQDHKIPRSRGGRTVKENIVPACRTCNSLKGNRVR